MSQFVLGAVMLAALLAALGAGARAARRALLPAAEGPTAWLLDGMLAITALVVISEALGTLGWFDRVPLLIAGVLVGGSGWALLRERRTRVGQRPRDRSFATARWLGISGCAALAAQWAAWTSGPLHAGIYDFDSLNYHLTFAARFVQTGSITGLHFVSPDVPIHLYPQNSELLNAVGMAMLRSDLGSVFANVGWALFAILGGWSIGRRRGIGAASGLAVAVVLASPVMAWTQAGSAEDDVAALALFLASAAVLVDLPCSIWAAVAGGLAAGLAVGTKLTLIIPCAALGAMVVVRAARGTRRRTALAWSAGAVIAGSYWYVRNLIATGSPLSALHLGVGPVAFPHARFLLLDELGYSVAHYWNVPHVWSTAFIPGLSRLGAAWPVLLGLVLIGIAYALVRGSRTARTLALIAAVSLAGYLVTPTGAIGFNGRPLLFAENLRYATPALALGLMLIGLALGTRGERWRLGATAAMAALLAATLLPGASTPWPTAYTTAASELAAAGAASVLAGAALVQLLKGRGRLPMLASILGAVVALVAAGAALNHGYQHRRYAHDGVYSWVQDHLRHTRIAIAGFNLQYPLYGSDWTNYVQYVGTRRAHGGFTPARSCHAWRSGLAYGRFRYAVIWDHLRFDYPHSLPEMGWTTSDPHARAVYAAAGATVFKLTPTADPTAC